MLVTTKKMFEDAKKGGYAIPAPDFWDSNSCKAYLETAEELGLPCVLSYAQVHKDMMSIEEASEKAKKHTIRSKPSKKQKKKTKEKS